MANGFLNSFTGVFRAEKAQKDALRTASPVPVTDDPILDVSREWHPGKLELAVTQIRAASAGAKTFRLERLDGRKLPLFYAGQYMVLEFPVENSIISRPYSISSAPCEARLEKHPFVEITVLPSGEDGFASAHLLEEVTVGDRFTCLIGCGQFFYEPLRDSKNVVALASGHGITPFCSMAKEIRAGRLDADLTILYSAETTEELILMDELEACECDRVRVIPVISGEDADWQGERGLLTSELIQAYSAEGVSYFVCGPREFRNFVHGELSRIDIPQRRLRFESVGQVRDISACTGYPQELKEKTFRLTVVRGVHEDVIEARATESLAVALERAGIRVETVCRSGECGFCRTKVLQGDCFISPVSDGRRAADKDFHYVHACSAYPLSDMKIKIPIL